MHRHRSLIPGLVLLTSPVAFSATPAGLSGQTAAGVVDSATFIRAYEASDWKLA